MYGNLMWTVRQTYVSIEQYIHSQFNNSDIFLTQVMILHHLFSLENTDMYAVNLHNALGISKSSISSALKALKKNGYLKITADPSDDRKKILCLTDKAYAMQDTMACELQKQQELLCRNIPDERLTRLEEDLNIMIGNLKNKKKGKQEEDTYA